eukprot:TRINITY_DN36600_c0_g1_i1.p1 TRINITY_DN36600_c0_g1~~TRINITY_DN36600_c0_g1_i1.p1  ORF type:complete len:262 (+),score=41.85 TRINITY_DN36600_c0_g1_i1:163-948(+)
MTMRTQGLLYSLFALLFLWSPSFAYETTQNNVVNIQKAIIEEDLSVSTAIHFGEDQKLDVGLAPLGSITQWVPRPGAMELPYGWMICDGSTVTDERSRYINTQVPDLRGRFIMGTDLHIDNHGATNGAETHNHVTDRPAHQHVVDHEHPAAGTTTSVGGEHNHVTFKMINKQWWGGDGTPMMQWRDGLGPEGRGIYPLTANGRADETHYTDINEGHVHTDPSSQIPEYTGSSEYSDTESVEGTTASHMPNYMNIYYIMRVI